MYLNMICNDTVKHFKINYVNQKQELNKKYIKI